MQLKMFYAPAAVTALKHVVLIDHFNGPTELVALGLVKDFLDRNVVLLTPEVKNGRREKKIKF